MVEIYQNDVRKEAVVFTRHIIGKDPTEAVIALYSKAIKHQKDNLDATDKELLSLVVKYPNTVAYIDAGLAFLRPHSEVRHRLYLMFAILESTPEYTQFFLPVNRSRWYVIVIIGSGIQSIFRLLIGLVLVKVVVK